MESEILDKEIARKSANLYLVITLLVAVIFFSVASLTGKYSLVARIGGVIWVSLLTLIVSMPLVISITKKRLKGMR